MSGFQLAAVMWVKPTATIKKMMVSLSSTMKLLTFADSLMPITRIVDITATTNTAGRLMMAPVRLSPVCAHPAMAAWTFAAVHHVVGAAVSPAGSLRPKLPSRLTKWPDQPTPTVAAPAAYSSTRSQPMIQATSSPMVAYEYVYAPPATGPPPANRAYHRP